MTVERFGDAPYELLTRLGRGGMADLYVARRRGAGGFTTHVAIKRMQPQFRTDPEFRALFENEGRIAGRLHHPNVCQVFELGEAEGELYLAMEYLEGGSWDVVARGLPDEPGARLALVAGVLGQSCEGLTYAHTLRALTGELTPVIHRDVSPENLFVTIHGVCKVLDFGVSKLTSPASATRSGVVKGKIPYMAPEQLRGEAVDPRADVYSLGVVTWEALTGARLFARDTEYATWAAVLHGGAPPVSARAAGLGPAVDEVVARALAADREARYPTARAFAEALRDASAAHGVADASAIARLVERTCADRLARRAAAIAAATATPAPSERPAELQGTEATVMLRAGSVALAATTRALRRRPFATAAIVAAALGLGGLAGARWTSSAASSAARPASVAAIPPRPTPPRPTPTAPPTAMPTTPTTTAITAATTTATPSPDAAPAKATRPSTERRPARATVAKAPRSEASHARAAAASRTGLLSVDASPYAVVHIDGVRLPGTTPLYQHEVPAGRHELRLVARDGHEYRRAIVVPADGALNLGTVTW